MMNEIKWLDHIVELRKRLLNSFLLLIIIAIPLFYYANALFHLVALPLLQSLPNQGKMIATSISGPVFLPIKLALITALIMTMPLFLYHICSFIAPGLYKHEKGIIWPSLIISILLFYLGIAFAYFIAAPFLIHFFVLSTPQDILFMPDMSAYLSFILKLLLSFGLCFQIPIIIYILIQSRLVTYTQVKKLRRYVIVSSLILAMLIGPPDLISQVTLAIPIWLLYELGLFATLILNNPRWKVNLLQANHYE